MTNRFNEEVEEIDFLLAEATPEEVAILERDKKGIKKKQEIINNEIKRYNDSRNRELNLELLGAKMGVLFAINKYGNIMIEKDLKKIKSNTDERVYNSFLNLIYELITGEDNFNDIKQKPIQSDNNALKGIYEKKDYQSRVIYRYAGDYIVVIGAAIKKTDLNSKYRSFCINAKEKSDPYVEKIKNSSINIDDLSKQSLEFYNKIFVNDGGLKK